MFDRLAATWTIVGMLSILSSATSASTDMKIIGGMDDGRLLGLTAHDYVHLSIYYRWLLQSEMRWTRKVGNLYSQLSGFRRPTEIRRA